MYSGKGMLKNYLIPLWQEAVLIPRGLEVSFANRKINKEAGILAFHPPEKVAEITRDIGYQKVNKPIQNVLLLGFLAGVYISFGFLLDVRVTGNMPEEIWGSLISFFGAAVFPVGLVLVILAGAELLTGNMMADAMAVFSKKASAWALTKNWILVALSNLVGCLFVAYLFGDFLGLTSTGPFMERTVEIAGKKIGATVPQAFVSAIAANWLVCLSVWLAYAGDNLIGKILGIWFPIMAFVAMGFQHVVANMFIIPAAIFAGYFSWLDFLVNISVVFAGNAVGGAIFVGWFYWKIYLKGDPAENREI